MQNSVAMATKMKNLKISLSREQSCKKKIIKKTLIYLLGNDTSNHVSLMQPMLISYSSYYFSSQDCDIKNVSNIATSGN